MNRCVLAVAVSSVLTFALAADARAEAAPAGNAAAPATLDTMIVTGTRGSNRTQFDTLAPVDVFSQEEIQRSNPPTSTMCWPNLCRRSWSSACR